jgi:GNAT superfamily N-acetyltransferase
MKLRQAVRGDVPAMQRIRMAVRENRLTSTVISDEECIAQIETTGRGWVVTEKEAVVAFAIANRETRSIWALFVGPDHEKKGCGRQLHDAMVEWLFSEGVTCIWLSTEPGTRAQRFYETAGWEFCRTLPSGERYYELRPKTVAP